MNIKQVTITFDDGTEQVVIAPLVSETQGIGLADLQQSDEPATAPEESAPVAEEPTEEVTPSAEADSATQVETVELSA